MTSISYFKISISIIIIIIFSAIIIFSKKYFDKHYHNEQTVESNLNLYKVKNETDAQENTHTEQKLIEENPIEVTTNQVEIINETSTETLNEIIENTQQDTSKPAVEIKKEEQPIITPTIQNVTPAKKNTTKNTTTITQPKTLEKKKSLTQSVLKNPLFQGYIIQVGAFTEEKDAQIYKSVVSQNKNIKNYSVEIRKSTTNLHQVIVGYFENSETARTLCNKLKQENVQCFVTKI